MKMCWQRLRWAHVTLGLSLEPLTTYKFHELVPQKALVFSSVFLNTHYQEKIEESRGLLLGRNQSLKDIWAQNQVLFSFTSAANDFVFHLCSTF